MAIPSESHAFAQRLADPGHEGYHTSWGRVFLDRSSWLLLDGQDKSVLCAVIPGGFQCDDLLACMVGTAKRGNTEAYQSNITNQAERCMNVVFAFASVLHVSRACAYACVCENYNTSCGHCVTHSHVSYVQRFTQMNDNTDRV